MIKWGITTLLALAILVGLLNVTVQHRDRCIAAHEVGCTLLPWSGASASSVWYCFDEGRANPAYLEPHRHSGSSSGPSPSDHPCSHAELSKARAEGWNGQ